MKELREREVLFTERLIQHAGKDPIEDAKASGLIAAYREILGTTLEDLTDDYSSGPQGPS